VGTLPVILAWGAFRDPQLAISFLCLTLNQIPITALSAHARPEDKANCLAR
jgi:hypothetical protein